MFSKIAEFAASEEMNDDKMMIIETGSMDAGVIRVWTGRSLSNTDFEIIREYD